MEGLAERFLNEIAAWNDGPRKVRGATSMDRAKLWTAPALGGTIFLSADYRTRRFGRHFHEEYAIGIIEHGCQSFVYDGARRIEMTSGTVALISPGIVHSGGPGLEEGWRYRMLYPSQALVDDIVHDIFGHGAVPRFHSPGVFDPILYDAIDALHMATCDGACSTLEVETRMAVILRMAFVRHAGCQPPSCETPRHPGMRVVRDFLADNFSEDLGLQCLADNAGLSRFQLLRQFKAAYGLPPHAYLKQVRVFRVQAMILAGSSLAQAALAAGFADQSHMTRVFVESLGFTPGLLARR